ncbi:hypothetical protein D3C81_1735030 [compost metagenome]
MFDILVIRRIIINASRPRIRIDPGRNQVFIFVIKIFRAVIYSLIMVFDDVFDLVTFPVLIVIHRIDRFGQSPVYIVLILRRFVICVRFRSHQPK